jgi:dephospho-CoA kinase
MFARLGAATLSTDRIAHELLDDPRVRDALVERWGEEAAPNGSVDRERVGRIVFERPEELAWLEALLHPLVGQRIAVWRLALPASTALAVVEVPLLFEADMEKAFDATVCVIADEALRAARARQRGTDLFEERGLRQMSEEEKAARATHVVRNDGSLADLEAALSRLMAQLSARSEA